MSSPNPSFSCHEITAQRWWRDWPGEDLEEEASLVPVVVPSLMFLLLHSLAKGYKCAPDSKARPWKYSFLNLLKTEFSLYIPLLHDGPTEQYSPTVLCHCFFTVNHLQHRSSSPACLLKAGKLGDLKRKIKKRKVIHRGEGIALVNQLRTFHAVARSALVLCHLRSFLWERVR